MQSKEFFRQNRARKWSILIKSLQIDRLQEEKKGLLASPLKLSYITNES